VGLDVGDGAGPGPRLDRGDDPVEGAVPGRGPTAVGLCAEAGIAGGWLGDATAPPANTWDTPFVSFVIGVPVAPGVTAMAAKTTDTKMTAANATAAADTLTARPTCRSGWAPPAQRDCAARGLGPIQLDDASRTIQPMSRSSSSKRPTLILSAT
jgi:hypothetical protein